MGIETILGAGSLLSGLAKGSSAKKQAKAATAQAATETQLATRMYDESVTRLAPYEASGRNGLDAYLYELGLGPKPMVGATAPAIEQVITRSTSEAPRTGKSSWNIQDAVFGRSNDPNPPGGGGRTTSTTSYRVGSEQFKTAAEAEAYANSKRTGGTAYEGFDGDNRYRTTSAEFTADPGYQFRLSEGLNAVEGSAAARGGLYSGATMQAMQSRAANEADQTYGDWYNRYTTEKNNYLGMMSGLAGNGQNAAANQNSNGQAYLSNVSSAGRVGTAGQIAGYQGQADAVSGTINDMASIYGYFGKDQNPMGAYSGSTRPQRNPRYI
jgi:hypothetical protein